MASTITKFAHLQIPLEEILKATNNFADENVIGHGGFGYAYKGCLLRSGKFINISARRLNRKYGQGDVEFWTEVSMLSDLKHKNIVSLIGYCDEKDEKIIISTYEANGSLVKHLKNPNLTWVQRLRICVGVVHALSYLQYDEGRSYGVIHRNINSYTILLDENWEAKLSGFEISLKQSVNRMDQVLLSEAIGTEGYMDPTIEITGGVTHKSDIYSLGVVLFEILCGRKAFLPNEANRFLAPLAKFHYENNTLQDIIHSDLWKQMDVISRDKCSEVAYSCLKKEQAQRPDIDQVVNKLGAALELRLQRIKTLEHLQLSIQKLNLEHLKMPLSDVKLATDNFSERYCIKAIGKYFKLYRAQLDHYGNENPSNVEGKNKGELSMKHNVVIKRFLTGEDQLVEEAFLTNIEMLTACKHQNIVTLLGLCVESSEMILVIEHLPNGYLGDYFKNSDISITLTWAKRLEICLDVALALNYIHTETKDKNMIINRDMRSENIALDENWRAKIADFGFCIFLPPNQDDDALYLNMVTGTQGYIDPEYSETGKLKRESDVYSYGIVLFEILCGRLANDPIYTEDGEKGLASVARRCFWEGKIKEMIDPIIKEEIENNSLDIYLKIAFQCVVDTQDQRPTMEVVINELVKAFILQEEGVQCLDMDNIVDELQKPLGHKSTHENLEEGVQCLDMDNTVDELQKPLGHKSTHENLGKKMEHLKIPLSDIKLATDNFSETYCITTSDGYYAWYTAELDHLDKETPYNVEGNNKGELTKRHDTVLIKRLLPRENNDGEEFFFTELEMLTTCKHRNIVTLLGYCDEGSEMILIIEHLSNGYLGRYFAHFGDMPVLTWEKRLKICLDVANGLNYLHFEMEDQKMIINRGIRSDFIALDENWRAKIADFGFSVFLPPNQDDDALHHDGSIGTPGYVDPEYKNTGKLKRESDVYSFGVVLFEVLCGRRAYDPIYFENGDKGLVHVARRCFNEGKLNEMIDPKIKGEISENNSILNRGPNIDSLDIFLRIAYQCLAQTQDQRPTMKVLVKELEKALSFQEKKGYFRLSLEYIKLATQNFHPHHCIGGGGFGKVFLGLVQEGDGFHMFVVKRLDTSLGQGKQQFLSELQILSEYKHDNVIGLVGYCDENDEKIIVYEYESRGSLDEYLNDASVTWMTRLGISIDIATALDFLHGGAGTQATVIHRDIKAANILLNHDWKAKIADFGLSLISPINQESDYVIDYACGTRGYLDPVYRESGFLTKESDIYSFGVVLLEILCGRSTYDIYRHKGQFLQSSVKHMFEEGKHDEMVFEAIKEQIEPKSLAAFQMIACRCLDDDREKRPAAKEVLAQLKMALLIQGKNLEHLRKISLSDIKSATNDFSNTCCIGANEGYFMLYRADLDHFDEENPRSKRHNTVVIKHFLQVEMFFTEIEMLTICKHCNIVTLLGYCDEDSEMILVFEHLSNGYLSDYLENNNEMSTLSWAKRSKICLDIANGLNYLHSEIEDQKIVINRDIRSDNIALDENWRAKIVEFGFSVFMPPNKDYTLHTLLYGRKMYRDPEYKKFGKLKRESDVYSFGVLLFEILCGRRAYDPIYLKESQEGLVHMARQCFSEEKLYEMIDPKIKEETGENNYSVETLLKIALECVAETQDQRPTMKVIIKELEKALSSQKTRTTT